MECWERHGDRENLGVLTCCSCSPNRERERERATHGEATKACSLMATMTSLKRIFEVRVWPWNMTGSPSSPSQQSTGERGGRGRKRALGERRRGEQGEREHVVHRQEKEKAERGGGRWGCRGVKREHLYNRYRLKLCVYLSHSSLLINTEWLSQYCMMAYAFACICGCVWATHTPHSDSPSAVL